MLTGESTRYTHAVIVLDRVRIIEPWPSGVRISHRDDYAGEYVAYGWPGTLSGAQGDAIASAALSLDGTRYGMADYLALMLVRMGARSVRARRRVSSTGRLLPAQFVVEAYRRAGVDLLEGRSQYEATLDDLGNLFLSDSWELRVPAVRFT
ncbi:hypothetical protein ACFY05_32185 [Microtetraspora fusca]|uniref:Uncharacterized protein n=1 Tax=Microtetraspora fusca TaxID=1997 RepID=A0ABW6VDU7_MICFU